jgi:hypothetical protein
MYGNEGPKISGGAPPENSLRMDKKAVYLDAAAISLCEFY